MELKDIFLLLEIKVGHQQMKLQQWHGMINQLLISNLIKKDQQDTKMLTIKFNISTKC